MIITRTPSGGGVVEEEFFFIHNFSKYASRVFFQSDDDDDRDVLMCTFSHSYLLLDIFLLLNFCCPCHTVCVQEHSGSGGRNRQQKQQKNPL